MEKLSYLAEALEPVLLGVTGNLDAEFNEVVTDTRIVKPGNVFAAIAGERFDGHEFVSQAVAAGAVAVIVNRPVETEVPQFVVTDTGLAYGLSAKAWRNRFAIPFAVVAGSNGKTTTTQMLATVLRERWDAQKVCATVGNFNNEIGVPRMLWTLRMEHCAAVIECGMNHPGEMARLADWTRPNVALLTNAQREHQEFLKGVEATARENGLVIVSLPECGTAVYPADDACADVWASLAMARGVKTLTYSTDPEIEADVTGRLEDGKLIIETPEAVLQTTLNIPGEHNVHNAVGVAAAAIAMGIPADVVERGIAAFSALPGRGERSISASGNLTIIDDAYNANPDSVRASMAVLAREKAPKTFVLGDMGEVGEEVCEVHREVGLFAREIGLDALYATGENARLAVEAFGEGAHWYPNREALVAGLGSLKGTVCVKASHSMGFAEVVKALKAL